MNKNLSNDENDMSYYLDYNYGVNTMNLKITNAESYQGQIALDNDEIINPLFVGVDGGSLSKFKNKNIYSQFKRVFVVCTRNNFTESDNVYDVYDYIIKQQELSEISQQLIFIPASMNLLKNNYYKQCACILKRNELVNIFGLNSIQLENEEIIIPMIELNETTARMNLSLYDKQYGLDNISNFISLTNFYNKYSKKLIANNFSEILNNLKESQYWSNSYNCNINNTQKFSGRKLIIKNKSNVSTVSNQNIKEDKSESCDNNQDMYNSFNCETENASGYFHTMKNSSYYINNEESNITTNNIGEFFSSTQINSEKEKYNLLNSLLVSKEYCHTIINNKELLVQLTPLINKYLPMYKLLIGYAWLTLSLEEDIVRTNITTKNRFVFDIHTASNLPVFPFAFDDIHQNPYISTLVNNNTMYPLKNFVGLHCVKSLNCYGVCDLQTFKKRLNLFSTERSNLDIFNGLDWKNFAITGSVMAACLQKLSPLFSITQKNISTDDENWNSFFNAYYANSDIDIMCNVKSIYEFADKVNDIVSIINLNLHNEVTVVPIKTLYANVTSDFLAEIREPFNEYYDTEYTTDELIENINSSEMKAYIYVKYVENKAKINSKLKKSSVHINTYMKHFIDISSIDNLSVKIVGEDTIMLNKYKSDSDILLYINNFRTNGNKTDDINNKLIFKISEIIKFKITSPKLHRSIELFRCTKSNFFGIVSKFHFPCVRSYYQGDNVYMLPSCITSMMTGLNTDYKYFASSNNPCDIMNKYRMRGFGMLLSSHEKESLIQYNNNLEDKFHIDSNDKSSFLGSYDLNYKIFTPDNNIPINTTNTSTTQYIKNMNDVKNFYETKFPKLKKIGLDVFKFSHVLSNGCVSPYLNEIPKLYYDLINSK